MLWGRGVDLVHSPVVFQATTDKVECASWVIRSQGAGEPLQRQPRQPRQPQEAVPCLRAVSIFIRALRYVSKTVVSGTKRNGQASRPCLSGFVVGTAPRLQAGMPIRYVEIMETVLQSSKALPASVGGHAGAQLPGNGPL